MPDLNKVVSRFRTRVNSPAYERRLVDLPEAARAEALVFSFLTDHGLGPAIHEDPSLGGADFECNIGGSSFAVEVTAIANDTFGEKTGMSENIEEADWADISPILSLLRSRISRKGTGYQAAAYQGPQVLAVVAEHYFASAAFLAVIPELLTGESMIAWHVGPTGSSGDLYLATDFENAAHVRPSSAGEVEAFRPKHALILLIAAHLDACDVVGISHPSPDHKLPDVFVKVPVASLRWPPQNESLEVTWTLPKRPLRHIYQ